MKTVLGIIVAVLIIGGVWYVSSNSSQQGANQPSAAAEQNAYTAPTTDVNAPAAPSEAAASPSANTPAVQATKITYDGSSFSPSSVTIHVGDTVEFVDSSSNPMWVASGVHPAHTKYDGTDLSAHCAAGYAGPAPFDQCKASASYSFTFTKAGTWPFHNHVKSSATGKVIVE